MDKSPWPLAVSLSLGCCVSLVVGSINKVNSWTLCLIPLLGVCLSAYQWWRDVVRESTFQGKHTAEVCSGLYAGVCLLILSEVLFFFSFFFSYFYLALNPDVEVGGLWPPEGVSPISFTSVPLLNTLLLLSSGVTVTWAHHAILAGMKSSALSGLVMTLMLGGVFSLLQVAEYIELSFSMADSVWGSIFYLMTGFHGLHVNAGLVFLLVGLIRLLANHWSSSHHLGFEAAAWYWHFVDVVWLGLYVTIYWWGCS